ncbi:MAG: NUDIX hydrolase [Desulfobacterales bacterium]|nr:NUDIX hydrolase [Desulfobacterales bacterium]
MRCPHCGKEIAVYNNPLPTVDIIIENKAGIVLVKRKNKPLGWALPGGFVDYGESLEQAAVREALEETGLAVTLYQQFHTYSDPGRDQRHHTISTVFLATAQGSPRAGDDAGQARYFTEKNLPELVFDHQSILRDYFRCKGAYSR